jgi:hypothetical protein
MSTELKTTTITAADLVDGEYRGDANVAGHLVIDANLGWVRFTGSLTAVGSIRAEQGITAVGSIRAGMSPANTVKQEIKTVECGRLVGPGVVCYGDVIETGLPAEMLEQTS